MGTGAASRVYLANNSSSSHQRVSPEERLELELQPLSVHPAMFLLSHSLEPRLFARSSDFSFSGPKGASPVPRNPTDARSTGFAFHRSPDHLSRGLSPLLLFYLFYPFLPSFVLFVPRASFLQLRNMLPCLGLFVFCA